MAYCIVTTVVFVSVRKGVVREKLQSPAESLLQFYLQRVVDAARVVPKVVPKIAGAANNHTVYGSRTEDVCTGRSKSVVERATVGLRYSLSKAKIGRASCRERCRTRWVSAAL